MNPNLVFRGNEIDIYQIGPELLAITREKGLEYSRLNLQTKKATHWYARIICDKIISFFPKKQTLHICCLGSSMGAIPYELLASFPNAEVTCVDIDKESLYILQHSILKPFGNRVLYKEIDANHFVKKMESNRYDIVINDLFSEDISPPFIHTETFIQNIWNIIKPKGIYFANTYTDSFDTTHESLLKMRGFHVKKYLRYPIGKTNIVFEGVKP
jgi:2-polyprenyl-3-methyl-5-hydroxy-6-metoxy-1,4-benzoquinol methylase